MKSGFFSKSKKTSTSSTTSKSSTKATIETNSTSLTLSSSSTQATTTLVTSPLQPLSLFNLYPKESESTTLHWSFYPPQTSPSNPIGECIFYITTFSLELFKSTTWLSSPSPSSSSSSSALPTLPHEYHTVAQELKGKGKSLLAALDIQPNTLIMYTRPLLIWDSSRPPPRSQLNSLFKFAVSQLNPFKQAQFLELFNCLSTMSPEDGGAGAGISVEGGGGGGGRGEGEEFWGRVETNGFPVVQFEKDLITYSAIFPSSFLPSSSSSPSPLSSSSSSSSSFTLEQRKEVGYSILNHSCFPNTLPKWNETQGWLEIRTTRFVKKGEELTCTYILTMQKRRERRYELKLKYKFHCMCEWCSLNDEESAKKDEDRELIAAAFLKEWSH